MRNKVEMPYSSVESWYIALKLKEIDVEVGWLSDGPCQLRRMACLSVSVFVVVCNKKWV